ncbi:MAG TPA: chemotaxis protein CheW [Pyrinomonadaceae bacterium]|jgi:chemotaxis signal transduction protein
MNNESIDNAPIFFDDSGSQPASRKLQLVRAGSQQLGIFTDEIAAIVAWQEPAPLPHSPKSVRGVVSVEGRMLTVLDLMLLTTGKALASSQPGKLIALRGDEQLALAVTEVGEAIDVAAEDFASAETTGSLVVRKLRHAGGQVSVLNLKELFPAAIQGRERRRRRF